MIQRELWIFVFRSCYIRLFFDSGMRTAHERKRSKVAFLLNQCVFFYRMSLHFTNRSIRCNDNFHPRHNFLSSSPTTRNGCTITSPSAETCKFVQSSKNKRLFVMYCMPLQRHGKATIPYFFYFRRAVLV